jgi:hypothetical protein
MVTHRLLVVSLFCLTVLSSSAAFASEDLSQMKIPTTEPSSGKAVSITNTDAGEGVSRDFNTPTDDGRPGEYYFALGVQAARKGDYMHAMAMYKVAASWAYKPADYNLGVMYVNGQGAPADLPRALAWMALAAERNDPEYVHARQLVYSQATPEQYEQANVIWRELLSTFGDQHTLSRAKARWRQALFNATGSRVGSSAAPVQVGGVDGAGAHMRSANYDVHDGFNIGTSPVDLVGAHVTDASTAYETLRASSNPYDPKVTPVSGRVNVGELTMADPKESAPTKVVMQLFGADDVPSFHAYLACVSNTVNCSIVERAFDLWADTRHVRLDSVMPDDQAFSAGVPSSAAERSVPYRLTMRYLPDLSAPANPLGGGSMPLMISYTASVQVFDAETGRLLKTMSFKDKMVVDQNGGLANPYINAQVKRFLKHVDPAYENLSASRSSPQQSSDHSGMPHGGH